MDLILITDQMDQTITAAMPRDKAVPVMAAAAAVVAGMAQIALVAVAVATVTVK